MSCLDFGDVGRSLWNVGYRYNLKGNDLGRESSSELPQQFFPGHHRRGRWNSLEQPPITQRSPGHRGFSRQIRRINRRIPMEIKVEHFLSHVEKNMKENSGLEFIQQPSEVNGDMSGAVDQTKWNPFKSVNLSPKSLEAEGQSEEFKFVGVPAALRSQRIPSCIHGAIGDHLREKGSCYGKLGDILNLDSSPDPSTTGISSSGSYYFDPVLAMLRASQESWYQFTPWVSSDCWVFTESLRGDELEL